MPRSRLSGTTDLDLLGMTEGGSARFVKQYATIGQDMTTAIAAYADEVRQRVYPGPEHVYSAGADAVLAARTELDHTTENAADASAYRAPTTDHASTPTS